MLSSCRRHFLVMVDCTRFIVEARILSLPTTYRSALGTPTWFNLSGFATESLRARSLRQRRSAPPDFE
jgi:hypothetical protein